MTDYPLTERFDSATIVLPVMNETTSLEETVRIILRDVRDRIRELLIVVCDRTTPAAMATVNRLKETHPELVVVHHQKLPFLGGAMREAFQLARGSHVVMMASDLETDPNDVRVLIAEAEKNPSAIVTASRWLGTDAFQGYSKVKLVCNWIFQRSFSILYGVRLSDMTYAYRIFPTKLVQGIHWDELRHPLLFETLVKPLRLGVPVIEIPSVWRARTEGESQNTFFRNFVYFRTGLKTRFASRESILETPPPALAPGEPPPGSGKKGTGSEPTGEKPARDDRREVPVPLFHGEEGGAKPSNVTPNRAGNKKYWWVLAAALLSLWLVFGAYTAKCVHQNGGHLTYTLDDGYISMAIAKNLEQHGTWGVCPGEFCSSASSLLWIFLLGLAYWCVGVHQSISLILNVVFASLLLTMVWAMLRSRRISPWLCFLVLLLVLFMTPLVPVAFTGLEHILQACVVLAFAYATSQSLAEGVAPKAQAAAIKALLLLAPVVTLVRYEGLFLLAVVALLFLIRKRIGTALLIVGLGVLPVAVAGAVFLSKGWFFLPVSLLMKGNAPHFSSWPAVYEFFKVAVVRAADAKHLSILMVAAFSVLLLYGRGILRRQPGIMALVFLGVALLHLQFAGLGWFYRYEAYLMCLGVVTLVLLLDEVFLRQGFSWQSLAPQFRPAWAKGAAVALPLAFFAAPLLERAIQAHRDTSKAQRNNYEQQYQMGLFLHEYYQGAGVAANDIGAISFLADLRCLDLMGLADLDVFRWRRAGQFNTARIREIAHTKNIKIAIVYDYWFTQQCALPPEWIKVGEWSIADNVICADGTVAFYAVDRPESVRLRRCLGAFQQRLPQRVAVNWPALPVVASASAPLRK